MNLPKPQFLNLDFLQTIKGVIGLLRDPNQTESVYDIEDGLRDAEATRLAIEYMKSQPEVAKIIQERYLSPSPDLTKLATLPPNSLGNAYATYITQSGFDANFYRKTAVTDDISYVLLRFRQTHDIWHVVTGMKTNVAGELGLKAFELAQTRRPMAVVLLAGGILATMFKNPSKLDEILNEIAKGYRLGTTAKPFFAQKWEDGWEKPLTQWREELGIASK